MPVQRGWRPFQSCLRGSARYLYNVIYEPSFHSLVWAIGTSLPGRKAMPPTQIALVIFSYYLDLQPLTSIGSFPVLNSFNNAKYYPFLLSIRNKNKKRVCQENKTDTPISITCQCVVLRMDILFSQTNQVIAVSLDYEPFFLECRNHPAQGNNSSNAFHDHSQIHRLRGA